MKTQQTTQITVLDAIKKLASVCDGAATKDNQGFSGADRFLNNYATVDELTVQQQEEFRNTLKKYSKTQLAGYEIVVDYTVDDKRAKRSQGTNERKLLLKSVEFADGKAFVKFDYNITLLSNLKNSISPSQRKFYWDNKIWEIELNSETIQPLKKLLDFWHFPYDEKDIPDIKPKKRLPVKRIGVISDNTVGFAFPFDKETKEDVKLISGRKWNMDKKYWSVELNTINIEQFLDFTEKHKDFHLPEEVLELVEKIVAEKKEEDNQIKENKKLSKSLESDFEVREGLNGTLRPFQKSGVEYIVKNKKVILGDEMGCISGDAEVVFDCFGKIKLRDAYEKLIKQECSEVSTLSLSKYNYGKISLEEAYERFGGKSFYLLPKYKEIYAKFGQKLFLTNYLFNGIDLEDVYSEFGQLSRYIYTSFFIAYLFKRNRVEKIIYKGVKEVVEVALESKKTLKLTPDHEVLTNEGYWVEIGKLDKGSIIASEDEFNVEFEKIISIKEAGKTDVYDIVMADPYRNFIANGIVVHNCGKTIEALAAVHHTQAFPTLIVCPNTIKYNWKNEWLKWTNGLTVQVVESADNPEGFVDKSDVYITNYNTITKYKKEFVKCKIKSLIVDESHYAKNPKALRSKALSHIKENSNTELTILLSGTFISNRPKEAINQLNLIGKLDYFGGFWEYAKRYCRAHRTRFGLDINGSANLEELHEKLRECCYIRRNKEDVLTELPDKIIQSIEVDITNRKEYNKAEKDLIDYLRNEIKENDDFLQSISNLSENDQKEAKKEWHEEKVANAEQAEHLVRINTLKQLVAKGKMKAAIEFISDIIESDGKIVVFAVHKEVVNQISEHFKCRKIDGSVRAEDRQATVDDFQNNPKTKVIAINIAAGREGLTLTAANKMLFIEQGWTPGEHDQAEARIHRIGQKNAANVYYLLGNNTIDQEIYKLIAEKREVTNAVNKGEFTEKKGKGVVRELIANLTK